MNDPEGAIRDKFNIRDIVPPSSCTLADLMSSLAFVDSFTRPISFVAGSSVEVRCVDIYGIVVRFVEHHKANGELEQILFPLFCHVIIDMRDAKVGSDQIHNFVKKYILTVPAKERDEARQFVADERVFTRLASLFRVQRYFLHFSDETASVMSEFLNCHSNYKLRAMFADIFVISNPARNRPCAPSSRAFGHIMPGDASLVVGNMDGATQARVSSTESEVFAVLGDQRVVRVDLRTTDSQDIGLHQAVVTTLALSSSGSVLVSADMSSCVHLWSVHGEARFNAGLIPVWSSDFAPQGGVFVLGCDDGSAKMYTTERHQQIREFTGHGAPMVGVGFHPNCAYVGSTGGRALRLWDTRTAECVRVFKMRCSSGHAIAFSPDGRRVAAFDGGPVVFDIALGKCVTEGSLSDGGVAGLSFSANGRALHIVGRDGAVYDMQEDATMRTIASVRGRVVSSQMMCNELRVITTRDY